MNELQAVLSAWRELDGMDRDAVLATVVHVTGSAYRRPGARMLILPSGRRIGAISGGCLEGDISRKAWWFTAGGTPVVRTYDTTSDDAPGWDFGMGCNGVVHVMLERVTSPESDSFLWFLELCRRARESAVVATVIRSARRDARCGDRLMLGESGICSGTLAGTPLEPLILPHAHTARCEQKSCLFHLGETGIFVEWIPQPLSLVVFGAGDDAIPLVSMASGLGWNVTVADGRPAYAKPDRFPGAAVVSMSPADLLHDIEITSKTAVVIMTHNYPLDARLLPLILARHPRYIGMLGPKERAARLFNELALRPPASVHAPVGLDIGCDTPAAVALSIVAEIQAALSHRAGGMLKDRASAIHSPALEAGSVPCAFPIDSARPSYCETMVGSNV